jgi:ABC-type lipoprotein release transport system permease subunit
VRGAGRRRGDRPGRLSSVLAVVAMAASVALPAILLSVGGGVSSHELTALGQSGFQVTVSATGTHGISDTHALAHRIATLASVRAASPVLSAAIDFFFNGSGAVPLLAEGVEPAPFVATAPPSQRALLPARLNLGDATDTAHFANGTYGGPWNQKIALSAPLARIYGIGVGATIWLSPTPNRTGAIPFLVTGLIGGSVSPLGTAAAFAALLELSDLQALAGLARTPSGALIDASDSIEVALVPSAAGSPAAVQSVARSISALVPYYGVSALSDQAAQTQKADAVLTGFYLALSSVSLSVGLVFLGVVLVRRVESERALVAVQRALGVPPRALALESARRALALAAAGVAIGLAAAVATVEALGAVGPPLVRAAADLAVFDPLTLGSLAAGVLALALLAGAAAARVAFRLPIAEALR